MFFAALYSCYATALWLLSGPSAFERVGASFQAVIVTYLVTGLVGGAVVGLLLPWWKYFPGALVLGLVTAFVFGFAIETATHGPVWRWNGNVWFYLAVFSLLFGIGGPIAIKTTFRE